MRAFGEGVLWVLAPTPTTPVTIVYKRKPVPFRSDAVERFHPGLAIHPDPAIVAFRCIFIEMNVPDREFVHASSRNRNFINKLAKLTSLVWAKVILACPRETAGSRMSTNTV